MSEMNAEVVAKAIEAHCENSPPEDAGDVSELWDSFDPESLDQEIADLWRWGIIEVSMKDGEQYLNHTEFGNELHEKGLADLYVSAKLGDLPDMETPDPSVVRVLNHD